ncbi:MAG: PAS domain-containing sensor histidine kinase [Acetobacteraceae bacterium]|nr:PAS domain-containing sensor histidine kinase [Acetobacteraceae bacterium]
MNGAAPPSATLQPAVPPAGRRRPTLRARLDLRARLTRLIEVLLGRAATLVLAAVALTLGVATFAVLASGVQRPNQVFALVLANLVVVLLLAAALAVRLTRVWMERRRAAAGARLHVRLVLLFSVVAVTPAIVVAVFATLFFNFGIQAWFADPVRTALQQSLSVARAYADEHRSNIRADALGMAADLVRGGLRLMSTDPNGFLNFLATQTGLRGLTDSMIYEPVTGQVVASAGGLSGLGADIPPAWATELARSGEVAVLGSDDQTKVRGVVMLETTPTLMLVIGRLVDPTILDHIVKTESAVALYERLDHNRTGLQVTFAVVFALVALGVLAAAVLIGLVLANQIARPVGGLISAAERVRAGDLTVRVTEVDTGDDIAGLSRAFNRMTGQLAAQRGELMDAYSQIDERRRFTETVLSGVSAGVIGLDPEGRIELPNRAAGALLGRDLLREVGRPLAEVVPEFAPLLEAAIAAPAQAHTAEIHLGSMRDGAAGQRRTLLLRIGADRTAVPPDGDGRERPDRVANFVATFDDITELQSAQRTAAWADVARRIAHEIKNPLTPIQLSAERLKRRFAGEITSDRETFIQCADTIVRHVGDIGRMVDEFSRFARMPQPVIKPEDIGRVVRESLVLQRQARQNVVFTTDIPDHGPTAPCDRRQIGQAVTNLLQNAADSLAMRPPAADGTPPPGHIAVGVALQGDEIVIVVADDGIGLPGQDRDRLTEPYVTHKPRGTGLGLAIVKKIMEDHGGRVTLADRAAAPDWPGGGAVACLFLPLKPAG